MEPDVWVMTQGTVLDATIDEQSMTAAEVEILLFALDRSRAVRLEVREAWTPAGTGRS
jgi:hypothetical protein